MQNEIIVNASEGETRVAILERGQFVDLAIERPSDQTMVGSIVKGRVTRVLPGMQAAFVDIGLEKAAFLYVGDYVSDDPDADNGGDQKRRRRRNGSPPPRIDTLLSEGQEVVVQVAKEPIGTKGARITSHVSIPGRHLVLTPWGKRVGVSRRIDSDKERRRLREIVERLRPRDLGFIIRTAGDGLREADLEADIRYLTEIWDETQIRKQEVRAPYTLYQEPSLALRVIRDVATSNTKRIVIDSAAAYEEMQKFVKRFVADPAPRIDHYTEPVPIFEKFGIESQIDSNLGRKVWLKSGGYLIIDQSEALTAIDVNTGRFVGKRDLEETVLKTNLEAVKEVVRQLRFRNIGGLIIIDLIDMESGENRDKVNRALNEAFRQDKARTNVLKISELGLVEMTRKRTAESLVQRLCEPCPYCEGKSYIQSAETVSYRVLREIRKDLARVRGNHLLVTASFPVAELLVGRERKTLEALQQELGCEIEIRAKAGLHHEQFEVTSADGGPAVEFTPRWLSAEPEEAEAEEPQTDQDAPEGGWGSSDLAASVLAGALTLSEADLAEPDADEASPEPDEEAAEAEPEPAAAPEALAPEWESLPSMVEPEPQGVETIQTVETVDAEREFPILPDPEKPEES